jgi:hypothetical protein
MSRIDSYWARLLHAAAAAPRELPNEAPFAMETRLLAEWNGAPSAEDESRRLVPVFRAAFLAACVIILISITMSLRSLDETPPNEMVVIDSAIQLTLLK